jgi:hypothetical protein
VTGNGQRTARFVPMLLPTPQAAFERPHGPQPTPKRRNVRPSAAVRACPARGSALNQSGGCLPQNFGDRIASTCGFGYVQHCCRVNIPKAITIISGQYQAGMNKDCLSTGENCRLAWHRCRTVDGSIGVTPQLVNALRMVIGWS